MRELEVKHETATRRMGEMHMDMLSSAPPHRKPEVFMQNKVPRPALPPCTHTEMGRLFEAC